MSRIYLVRHGRSAHVHTGSVDLAGFRRWRESYEAASIADGETPPDGLIEVAAQAAIVVSSNAPRAIASAKLLREEVVVSALLRELDLDPPPIRGVKLPLAIWALSFGVQWLTRRSHATPDEEARARDAAAWLAGLANGGAVVAVTHHSFRAVLTRTLVADGWTASRPRRRHHWSVWSFDDDAATPQSSG